MSWGFDSDYAGLRFRYLPEAGIMFDCSSPEFVDAVKNRDERIFEIFEKWIENESEWWMAVRAQLDIERQPPPNNWVGTPEELRDSAKEILKNKYISEGTRKVYSDILDWLAYQSGELVLSMPKNLKKTEAWQAYLAQFNWDVPNFVRVTGEANVCSQGCSWLTSKSRDQP